MKVVIIGICIFALIGSAIIGLYPKILYRDSTLASSEQIAQMEANSQLCYRDNECTSPCPNPLSCAANFANKYFSAKNNPTCNGKVDNCSDFDAIRCQSNKCVGVYESK